MATMVEGSPFRTHLGTVLLPGIALLEKVPGGRRKWRLIEKVGPMKPLERVWIQRAGLSVAEAHSILARFTQTGNLPEPIRTAHLIASGVTTGESRHRP